jgi:Na+ dependent nucleoside transporter N-terminus
MDLGIISLLGWFTVIAVAWAISTNRKLFPWRTVIWGVGLQFTLAVLILKMPWGGVLFEFAGKVIQKLIQFSKEGCKFVFGPLADEGLLADKFGPAAGWCSPFLSWAPSSSSPAFPPCFIIGAFCNAWYAPLPGCAQGHAHEQE